MTFKQKQRLNFLSKKSLLITFFVFVILLIVLNYQLKVKNINIEILGDSPENPEIESFIEKTVRNKANTFVNLIFLNQDNLTKEVHDEYEVVGGIEMSKNYKLDVNLVVKKNEEFFYTCVPEEEGFLVSCMLGNLNGEFYKEISTSTEGSRFELGLNPKVLFDIKENKKIESPDSLSGARIYTKQDFFVLREIINWLEKNGFSIKKVYVDELKIVDITTKDYVLKVSLDKGYVDTVKDFELISRTGKLQEYINEKRDRLDYIDLSFKNKVFYKLKGGTATTTKEIVASTSTSTIQN